MYKRMFKPGNLVNFRGRASRREMFILGGVYFLALIALFYLHSSTYRSAGEVAASPIGSALLYGMLGIYVFLNTALLVRRVHDQDRPWYFLLVFLVPLIGQILLFLAITADGTDGENSYGADPRDPFGVESAAIEETFN